MGLQSAISLAARILLPERVSELSLRLRSGGS